MSLVPESLLTEVVSEATNRAYRALSERRKYEVGPGDSVCYLIAPDVASKLTALGYEVEATKLKLNDETYNWVLFFYQNGLIIDVTWLSCIPSNLRAGLPEILVYRSRHEVEGLNGETIPADIIDLYFDQFFK